MPLRVADGIMRGSIRIQAKVPADPG